MPKSIVEQIVNKILENPDAYFGISFEGDIIVDKPDRLMLDILFIIKSDKSVDGLPKKIMSKRLMEYTQKELANIENCYKSEWKRKRVKLVLLDKIAKNGII